VEYDEERELTRHVWDHYHQLLTEFERRVGRAIDARTKAATSTSPEMAGLLNQRWGAMDDLAVEKALAEGPDAYRRRVRDRVITDHKASMYINRCPRCKRVVRTPLARQCFWCSFAWHNVDAEQNAAVDRGNRS
jgi:hypothetical protein